MGRIDARAGDALEWAVRAKHRLRLRRLGRLEALEPQGSGLWAMGDPPPRSGCSLDVLVDGADAFPKIADAIAAARDHVYITGWHVAAEFELDRGEPPLVLGQLLAEA